MMGIFSASEPESIELPDYQQIFFDQHDDELAFIWETLAAEALEKADALELIEYCWTAILVDVHGEAPDDPNRPEPDDPIWILWEALAPHRVRRYRTRFKYGFRQLTNSVYVRFRLDADLKARLRPHLDRLFHDYWYRWEDPIFYQGEIPLLYGVSHEHFIYSVLPKADVAIFLARFPQFPTEPEPGFLPNIQPLRLPAGPESAKLTLDLWGEPCEGAETTRTVASIGAAFKLIQDEIRLMLPRVLREMRGLNPPDEDNQ